MPVSGVLQSVSTGLVAHFGVIPQRASVSFLGVDPVEILRFLADRGLHTYVTLGMSRHPMTGAHQSVLAEHGPRAELLLKVWDSGGEYREVWRRLALLGAAPAVEGVVFEAGMSVDLGEPLALGSACTGVVVDHAAMPAIETDVGPVDVLPVIPATPVELAWCRVRGSEALRQRWTDAGTDLADLGRGSVPLQ